MACFDSFLMLRCIICKFQYFSMQVYEWNFDCIHIEYMATFDEVFEDLMKFLNWLLTFYMMPEKSFQIFTRLFICKRG